MKNTKKKLINAECHLAQKIFELNITDISLLRNILVEAYFEQFWKSKQKINNENIVNFRYRCVLKAISKIDDLKLNK